MSNAFVSDLLASITERGRALLRIPPAPIEPEKRAANLLELCENLMAGHGEASGTATARAALDRYYDLDEAGRVTFFKALAEDFGPIRSRLEEAIDAWRKDPTHNDAGDLHLASEPRRQELFRLFNRAPGGTGDLVQMRADLLALVRKHPEIAVVDRDLVHLFGSWFNRGFLVLRRIDWSTPANILEKVIRYEAVHEIHDWDDLRRRIDPVDRRCYAFFHPALTDEPLIFVEVALTETIPSAIAPLLAKEREPVPINRARTAVFYSISNCQRGLARISFGNFLIKQVVEELRRELPKLDTFVTLSPVPGFMAWLKGTPVEDLPLAEEDRPLIDLLDTPQWIDDPEQVGRMRAVFEPVVAHYFLKAKTAQGLPVDPVARFHLGNGARLERVGWLGDRSTKGLRESGGVMVNYLYDLDDIEKNHEAFANQGEVAVSNAVRRLMKTEGRRYLPIGLGG
ncbi:MAG TPA: malonyl-CoA decarboxylase [Xanthobacteraceae bacterium]|nr:malonyl-CoA decarboxylase [Xanthobacteraceae bacterium]